MTDSEVKQDSKLSDKSMDGAPSGSSLEDTAKNGPIDVVSAGSPDKPAPGTQVTNPRGVYTEVGPAYKVFADVSGEILLPAPPAFGLRLGAASSYTPVPISLMSDKAAEAICWRIEFHGLAHSTGPVGFDIFADVILGRTGTGTQGEVIDLEPFQAQELGVSRRHAMLRPSASTLFLLDLDSSNGTLFNAMNLPPSSVRALQDGDTLSLGNLTFQLKIIDSPKLRAEQTSQASQPTEASPEESPPKPESV